VIDVTDEDERAIESDGAQHDEEVVAEHQHVTKVERGLENPRHLGTIEIIEKGISIDEDSRRSPAQERLPPPLVIFHGKLEVSQRDGDASSDDQEQNEDEEQDSVQRIRVVAPHTCIYIVQFDVNGTEWEESGHYHLDDPVTIPGGWWDCTGKCLVRHGAENGPAKCLPAIPPKTVRGKPTKSQIATIKRMVVKEMAEVIW